MCATCVLAMTNNDNDVMKKSDVVSVFDSVLCIVLHRYILESRIYHAQHISKMAATFKTTLLSL